MTEFSTLSAMAEAATIAGTLMPDNPRPGQFDTWAEFKTAFDGVDHLLFASMQEQLGAIRPGAPCVDEIGASLPDGEAGSWTLSMGRSSSCRGFRSGP